MGKIDYVEVMDQMIHLCNSYTIVEGFIDIVKKHNWFVAKDFKNQKWWWVSAGKLNNDIMVSEAFESHEFQVDSEGCYKFMALLSYQGADYDEYGRCTMQPILIIEHIKMEFECTFTQRDREEKLNGLLSQDLDIFDF